MAESPNRIWRTLTWPGILSLLGIEKGPSEDDGTKIVYVHNADPSIPDRGMKRSCMRPLTIPTCLLAICIAAAANDQFPFDKYPTSVFQGRSATPRLETSLAWQHRTTIRNRVKRGPNFAGHYTAVDWGCGTMCAVFVIVDARSGRVYEPPEISKGVELGVAVPEYRLNSTLIVVASCPYPKVYGYKKCERKFYNWDGSRLVLLKTEPVTPPTTAR
jgi:hypothetical protein